MGFEESSLSSKVLGNGGWKKVRFLRKFWGMGVGRKFAFFESFGEWGLEESSLSSKVLNMETRRVYVLFYTLLQECQMVAMYGQFRRLDSESTERGIPDSSFSKAHNSTLLLCLASK
jgi:hypothetical protein